MIFIIIIFNTKLLPFHRSSDYKAPNQFEDVYDDIGRYDYMIFYLPRLAIFRRS